MQGWVDLIDLLVRELHNQMDAQDHYQFTPLHSAANGGHVGAIRALLDFHHNVDMRDYQGVSVVSISLDAILPGLGSLSARAVWVDDAYQAQRTSF